MGLIDEIAVDRLLADPRAEATREERRAAALILIRRRPDLTRQQIADRVGVSSRTVERVAVANGLRSTKPCRANRYPAGETRAYVRAAVLADPRISCGEIARQLGLDARGSSVRKQYDALVAAGELPAGRGRRVRHYRHVYRYRTELRMESSA